MASRHRSCRRTRVPETPVTWELPPLSEVSGVGRTWPTLAYASTTTAVPVPVTYPRYMSAPSICAALLRPTPTHPADEVVVNENVMVLSSALCVQSTVYTPPTVNAVSPTMVSAASSSRSSARRLKAFVGVAMLGTYMGSSRPSAHSSNNVSKLVFKAVDVVYGCLHG